MLYSYSNAEDILITLEELEQQVLSMQEDIAALEEAVCKLQQNDKTSHQ